MMDNRRMADKMVEESGRVIPITHRVAHEMEALEDANDWIGVRWFYLTLGFCVGVVVGALLISLIAG